MAFFGFVREQFTNNQIENFPSKEFAMHQEENILLLFDFVNMEIEIVGGILRVFKLDVNEE